MPRKAESPRPQRHTAMTPAVATQIGSSWRADAACRGLGPAIFFDHRRKQEARSLCRDCPVRDECRAHAVATGEPAGIWGGLTPRQHRSIAVTDGNSDRVVRDDVGTRGPKRRLDDDQLRELFAAADPERPAVDAVRAAVNLSRAGTYVYLSRARQLGVVEQRDRRLYPVRHGARLDPAVD